MGQTAERRKFERVKCSLPAKFKNLEAIESEPYLEELSTQIQDISEGGVRFTSDKKIPASNRIYLSIHLPESDDLSVRAFSEWVAVVTRQDNKSFDIGASFLTLSEEKKEIIKKFIQSQAKG